MKKNKALLIVIKTTVSLGILTLLLVKTNISGITAAVHCFKSSTLCAAIFLTLAFAFWMSIKWKALLPALPFYMVLRISLIRYFYSFALFGTLAGDGARAYLLGKQNKDNAAESAASIIVDRVTGFAGLSLTGVAGLTLSSIKTPMSIKIACFLMLGVGFGVLFSLNIPIFLKTVATGLVCVLRKLKAPQKAFFESAKFIDSMRMYAKKPKMLFLSVGAGVVSQVLCILYCRLLAGDLGIVLQFGDWCWLFWVVSMAIIFPISISGIGIRESSFVGMLSIFGVCAEKALALSLSMFCCDAVLGCVGGIFLIGFKPRKRADL